MTDCLRRWIMKRLGLHLKLDQNTAGEMLYDGDIYLKLLKSYNYATDQQPNVKVNDSASALQKLRGLSIWLNMLGVTHDDVTLRKIANKDGTDALRLLFDLFVALGNASAHYSERDKVQMAGTIDRFKVMPSKKAPCPDEWKTPHHEQISGVDPCLQLSQKELKAISTAFHQHQNEIRQKNILECFKRRNLARTRLSINPIIADNTAHGGSGDGIKAAKKSDQEANVPLKLETKEGVIECSPEEYLYLLKLWRRRSSENEYRDRKTQSKLLHALWQHMIKQQTEEFHDAFTNKLLQQSTFEKRLAARLNRIHNNYNVLCENSEAIKNQIDSLASENFNLKDTYRVLSNINEEVFEEKRRVYELHRRIYDEKVKNRADEVLQLCSDTAVELVNYAIKYSEFKEKYDDEPPRNQIIEWKETFYVGSCCTNKILPDNLKPTNDEFADISGEELLERDENDLQSEVFEMIDVDQPTCNEEAYDQDVHDYMYLTGPWFYEKWALEENIKMEPDLMISGYIIHRLLENKYPFPEPPEKPNIKLYDVRMLLSPINEPTVVSRLKQLLNKYNIMLLDMQMSTNYCLNIYKKERSLSKIGGSMREKTDEMKQNKKKGKDKKKSQDDEKVSTKEKTSKQKETKENKAVQVPSDTEEDGGSVGHTRAGLLGKLAFEVLHGGNKLTDIHSLYMFIEYLKSLEDVEGWVLLNYPMSFQQAALIEFVLGGIQIRIPQTMLNELDVKRFGGTLQNDEPLVDPNLVSAFEEKLESLKSTSLKELAKITKVNEEMLHGEGEGEMVHEENTGECEELIDVSITEDEEMSADENFPFSALLKLRTSKILPRPNKMTYFAEGQSYFSKYVTLKMEPKTIMPYRRTRSINPYYPFSVIDPFPFYKNVGIGERLSVRKIDVSTFKLLSQLFLREIIGEEEEEEEEESSTDIITEETPTSSGSIECQPVAVRKRSFPAKSAIKGKRRKIPSRDSIIISTTSSSFSDPYYRPSGIRRMIELDNRQFLIDLKKEPPAKLKKWLYQFLPRKRRKVKAHQTIEGVERTLERRKRESHIVKVGNEESTEEEEVIACPGDPDWEYTELPVPITLLRSLATVWESVESTYLSNLTDLMTLYKMLDSKVLPYKMYVRKICRMAIDRPDSKQAAVTDFQLMFNYLDAELRINDDMKSELHCRVFELFNELCEMCDDKKEHAENQRRNMIEQNWTAQHAFAVINLAIFLLQIELDRFIDSLQIMYDYHFASLQKPPAEKRLEKVKLDKVRYPDNKISEEVTSSSTISVTSTSSRTKKKMGSKKDKKFKVNKITREHTRDDLVKTVPRNVELVILSDDVDFTTNPAHTLVMDAGDEVQVAVKRMKSFFDNIIKMEYYRLYQEQLVRQKLEAEMAEGAMENSELSLVEEKIEKPIVNTLRSTKMKANGKREMKMSLSGVAPPDFLSGKLEGPFNRLLWEWQRGVEDEVNRILFRVQVIVQRTKFDLDELLMLMTETFKDFTNQISFRYHVEVKNIHLLTNLFKVAIEEQQVIKPLIVLDQDFFFVDNGTQLFPEIPPPPPSPLVEPTDDFIFTVEQLTNIMNKLNVSTPDGVVEDSFVTILEDMAMFGTECGYPFLPRSWSQLTAIDIRNLIDGMFYETAVINWRDFLIFGLNIDFPTIEELLHARHQYLVCDPEGTELIKWDNFQRIILWFEEDLSGDLEQSLRLILVKEFLFKLYAVNTTETNYSAMLMAFCRDDIPRMGFAKALSLVSGKPFIVTARDLYKCKDQNYLDGPEIAEAIINQLLYDVLNLCEGVIITEIDVPIEVDKDEYYLNKLELERQQLHALDEQHHEEIEEDTPPSDENYWASLVPYDMVLTVIIYYLHFHPISDVHLNRTLRITEELKALFMIKGRWNVIRIYDLVESNLMKNIFNSTGLFKAVNLAQRVERLLTAKRLKMKKSLEKVGRLMSPPKKK